MAKHTTQREKAILYALAAGYITSWKEAYILGGQKPEEEASKATALKSTVSRWKVHPETIKAYNEVCAIIQAKENAIREEVRREMGKETRGEERQRDNESTSSDDGKKSAKIVDYSNPDNQRRKLNQIVNNAKDSGEALDALKVIIQGQRADREAAREQKTVRAYLPLTCSECPLMEKARKKAGKG